MEYEVTIAIPVYNAQKYIRNTMDSALAQSFQSIEFLVLDDCGEDGSMDIIREYQQNHSRGKDIRIVKQPQNMGIGCARNCIIDETRSRYLFFLDSDDMIKPNTISLLYKNIIENRAQIVYGSYERIESNEEKITKTSFCYPYIVFEKEDEFASWVYHKYDRLQATTWNFLIDIDVIRKNNLRYNSINYWEDFSFTMDLPTYITRAVLLPDITYTYNCHTNSLSNHQFRKQIMKNEIMDTIDAIDDIKKKSNRIIGKPYFPYRMFKVIMTDFYIVCAILKNKEKIIPSFTNKEIRDVMSSPLSIRDIYNFKVCRFKNLILYLLSVMHPSVVVILIKWIGYKYV